MHATRPENEITDRIIGVSIDIHRGLGPGLFESVYHTILLHKLRKLGHTVETEKLVGVHLEDVFIPNAFKADLIVDNSVIVEIKAVDAITKLHKRQLLTYLRLTGLHVGLLINFNSAMLVQGIERVVNDYVPVDYGDLSF